MNPLNFCFAFVFSILLLLPFDSSGQKADSTLINRVPKFEVWRQRFNIGVSAGYPTVPFLNLGIKFYDKIYFDMFIQPASTNKYSMYFAAGYQKNRLFDRDLSGQIGLSLMQVANKTETDKHTKPAINLKLIKPISNRFGLFLSGHFSYPDDRIDYGKLVNFNLGIEAYFKKVPLLF